MNKFFLICKSLTLAFLLIIGGATVQLQGQSFSVSGGLEFPALLIGNLGENGRLGIGATGRFQYNLNDKMALTATTGYISFFTNVDGVSLGAIPLQGGFKYHFLDGIYGLGELGVHIFRVKVTVLDVSATVSETDPSIGLGGGYEFAVGNLHLDIGARFQIVADGGSYIGVRTAIVFPVGGNSRSYRPAKKGNVKGVAPTGKKRKGTIR